MGVLTSDVKEIKIIWDSNPGRSYFPGEEISGKAVLITEKDDVKLLHSTIRFSGYVSVLWVEVSCLNFTYNVTHKHI